MGHGSREPAGVAEFQAVAGRVAQLAGERAVEACFLEFAEPAIADGFRTLVRRGVRRVVVVPVLLFAAGHAKRDIPAAVSAVAAETPEVTVGWAHHLGCHEKILALSRLRYDEATAQGTACGDDTVLVVVGRGSRDAEATAEMRRFVELRSRATPVRHAWTSFVAMAEPTLTGVLDEATDCGAKRIVVQPHLLFGGVLVERIALAVADYAARYPQLQWITTGHLGPADLVAQALLDRAREAHAPAGRLRNRPIEAR